MLRKLLNSFGIIARFLTPVLLLVAFGYTLVVLSASVSSQRIDELRSHNIPASFDITRDFSMVSLRLRGESPRRVTCFPGQQILVKLTFENRSNHVLTASLDPGASFSPINIGYFFTQGQERIEQDGPHIIFNPAVPPGSKRAPGRREIDAYITCPSRHGVYMMHLSPVQESVGWLADYSAEIVRVGVNVRKNREVTVPSAYLKHAPAPRLRGRKDTRTVADVWNIARNTLAQAARMVSHQGDQYLVFNAGGSYPMVWLRDMVSIQRALPYLLRTSYKRRYWVDIFLYHFHQDRGVPDWIQYGGPYGPIDDKNTVTSDHELLLVGAVHDGLKTRMIDTQWLEGELGDRRRISILQEAMNWFLQNRWDDEHSCFTSGHTADWGDVGLSGNDNATSTKLSFQKRRVCSIYTQALFLKAAAFFEQYAAEFYGNKLQRLKSHVQKFLRGMWQPGRGFFKMHLDLDHGSHDFEEDNIFALGGNLAVIDAGLTTREQSRAIFDTIVKRQKSHSISTVAGVLLPPYPAKTFQNPNMDEAYEYQNGGQWDWFGLRVLSLARDVADSRLWRRMLTEFQLKTLRNDGFYEWHTPSGEGKGSRHFSASAAIYIDQVMRLQEVRR